MEDKTLRKLYDDLLAAPLIYVWVKIFLRLVLPNIASTSKRNFLLNKRS